MTSLDLGLPARGNERKWPGDLVAAMAIVACYALACSVTFSGYRANDLTSVFMAAYNFSLGNLGGVYADGTDMFNLSVPAEWQDQANGLGLPNEVLFPFIYPPLWAALLSPLTSLFSGDVLLASAAFLNPFLLGISSMLVHRILRPKMGLLPWVLVSLAFVSTTTFGAVALLESQPQIVVSFLIILALERHRSGSVIMAGLALAVAASLKLYPALLAVFWLAGGNFRAFGAFAGFGAMLAGTSVVLAGWTLHLEYLGRVQQISETLIAAQVVYNLDGFIAQWQLRDLLFSFGSPVAGERAADLVVGQKPVFVFVLDRLVLIAGMTAFFIAFSRARSNERRFVELYPAALIFVSLSSPLAWSYHFLSAAFFFPIFLERHPRGRTLLVGIWIGFGYVLNLGLDYVPTPFYVGQAVGTIGLVCILSVFLRLSSSRERAA